MTLFKLLSPLSGNVAVRCQSEFASALEALNDRPLYAEKWANFRKVKFNNRLERGQLMWIGIGGHRRKDNKWGTVLSHL